MKKYAIVALIVLVGGVVLFSRKGSSQTESPTPIASKEPLSVTITTPQQSRTVRAHVTYPALIQGDQEAEIQAQAGGVIQSLNFDLGSKVTAGSTLARIDDSGNILHIGDAGFRSGDVQQSQLALDQAEEAIDVATKNYQSLKKLYDNQKKDPNAAQTVTKKQIEAAKEQIEIAELQRDSARVGFKSTINDRVVTAPFSGVISSRLVSIGDSVNQGQTIATISKTDRTKVQFFVEGDALKYITSGKPVSVVQNGDATLDATITNIAPQADPITKRFRIEATPSSGNAIPIGTVVSAIVEIERSAGDANSFILPLSAITVGQNESYVFVVVDGKAKKAVVTVGTIVGETAEVSGTISAQSNIIIEGSKLVKEGDSVVVK